LTGIGRILGFLIARYNIAGAAGGWRENKSRAACAARHTGLKDET